MRFLQRAVRLSLAFLLLASMASAQGRGDAGSRIDPATVVIRVRYYGGPLPVMAIVRIQSVMTAANITESTRDAGQATFRILPGRYQVEVSALGFQKKTEEIDVLMAGSTSTFIIEMQPEGAAGSAPAPADPLVLAPKARKELDKAVEAIRAKNYKAADESLEKVMKMAPGHPDAYYLMAMSRLQTDNRVGAQDSLKKALQLYPDHFPSLMSLGTIQYQDSSYQAAIVNMERAVKLNPDSWKAREVLAASYLAEKNYEGARASAARGIELAKGAAPQLQAMLGMAYAGLGETAKAREQLQASLAANPNHSMAAQARTQLAAIEPKPAPAPVVVAAGDAAPPPVPEPAAAPVVPLRNEIMPPPAKWPLTPVDAYVPKMIEGAVCTLPQVLRGAGKNAISLAGNLEKISATETTENVELDAMGQRHYGPPRRSYYVVSIQEPRAGFLAVDEYREPIAKKAPPPKSELDVTGLFAIALIFHPYYSKDFDMRCEGQTEWNGEKVWSVYFKQKSNRESLVRTYRTGGGRFPIPLKGRAFITVKGNEIVRMETNSAEPDPKLRLEHEHIAIEYEPVAFESRNVKLWLPASGEFLTYFRGKMHHTRYRMNDYLLFNVDVGERVQKPKVEEDAATKPPRD